MTSTDTPFEPDASLARIKRTTTGWNIDCRGPMVARCYDFLSAGDAAEFAIALRDEGRWPLRFGSDAHELRSLVEEIDHVG